MIALRFTILIRLVLKKFLIITFKQIRQSRDRVFG
uniref:Uncharacterized protein n=1 Tax=Caudovirales sp. ctGAB12 TaxID=2827632 RepID=A0A8S5SQ64_9CAUD|nr:MAG TPA: hypothetical protein [Caudovirales sp. ctGAB12]